MREIVEHKLRWVKKDGKRILQENVKVTYKDEHGFSSDEIWKDVPEMTEEEARDEGA